MQPAIVAAAATPTAAVATPLRVEVDAAMARADRANLKAAGIRDDRTWLERFYAPAWVPVWSVGGRPLPVVGEAIAQLQAAPERGLAAADYDAEWLAAEQARLASGAHPEAELARFDVALTLALLHYVADSHLGRLRSAYTDVPFELRTMAFDPVEQLRVALAQGRVVQVIVAAEPGFPVYQRLKSALARYRQLAPLPFAALPELPRGVKKIEPGGAYAGVAALREHLVLYGDLPATAPAAMESRYDAGLAEGVRRFQDRHGLLADGILGRQTLGELNVPPAARVRQIEWSMERLRWLPYFPDGPVIAVNIPSFRLWAFDGGSASAAPVLDMRVIVGQAVRTQTPAFIGEMRYIEFNPYWNVPPSIARKEIIPKLRRDPGYLARNDMEFVGAGKGGSVSTAVDEATLAALAAGRVRVRQRPGPTNALGTIKFALPNSDDIYLHSTPARQLFERSRRDFSHGCIRLENPAALAQFVLRDQPEWTAEQIAEAMTPGPLRTLRLKAPIPVVIFYTTAIADHDGRALFAPDVYKLDPEMESALVRRSAALAAYRSLRR